MTKNGRFDVEMTVFDPKKPESASLLKNLDDLFSIKKRVS